MTEVKCGKLGNGKVYVH